MKNFLAAIMAVFSSQVISESKSGEVNQVDIAKAVRSAVFYGSAYGSISLIEWFLNYLQTTDVLHNWQGVAVIVLGGILDTLYRAVRNNGVRYLPRPIEDGLNRGRRMEDGLNTPRSGREGLPPRQNRPLDIPPTH